LERLVEVLARSIGLSIRRWCDAGDKGAATSWGGDNFVFNFMGGLRNITNHAPSLGAESDLNAILRKKYDRLVSHKDGHGSLSYGDDRGGSVLRFVATKVHLQNDFVIFVLSRLLSLEQRLSFIYRSSSGVSCTGLCKYWE
jgi:hypothetical protein